MSRALSSVCAVALTTSACTAGHDTIAQVEACDVALSYVRHFQRSASKPNAVLKRVDGLQKSRSEIEQFVLGHPEHADDPDLELMLASADLRDQSPVIECNALGDWLAHTGTLHDDPTIDQITRAGAEFPVAIVQFSMPVVTQDGKEAFLFTSEAYGPLAGSSQAVTLRKVSDGS
ncbi:hypothetical protein [Altererythrobacter sp. Root672]|uniref:hypothetical protein n=1 Tax=Altererythrobacter sp. Root672 TaxID=1736584 RepID=UPI0012E37C66|nr:hypothetical protein [Altererythrobacter sp. Root672]